MQVVYSGVDTGLEGFCLRGPPIPGDHRIYFGLNMGSLRGPISPKCP